MDKDDQEKELIPVESVPERSYSITESLPKSQVLLILFALVSSNLFALLLGWLFEFLSLRGVLNIAASRFMLLGAWGTGVLIVCLWAWGTTIKAKIPTAIAGSVILAALLWGLDAWTPKPPPAQAAITVDPAHLAFDTTLPKETYSLFVHENAGMEAYSVQIKMTLSQRSSSDFTFDTPSPRPIMEGSPLTDIQGLRCANPIGHAVVMFWIYHMEPHSSREISITHNSNSTAVIDSKITYYTTKAIPRTGDRIHATSTFHFDEPLTCNGDITFQLAPLVSTSIPPVKPPTQPSKRPRFVLEDEIETSGEKPVGSLIYKVDVGLVFRNEGDSSARSIRIRSAGAPITNLTAIQTSPDIRMAAEIVPKHAFKQIYTIRETLVEGQILPKDYAPTGAFVIVLTYTGDTKTVYRDEFYQMCCGVDHKARYLSQEQKDVLAPLVKKAFPPDLDKP